MKNYKESDYALNKYSADIVYRFADGNITTVTLADYLAENPNGNENDFRTLKELSDSDYFQTDRAENAQTKRNVALAKAGDTIPRHAPSSENIYIDRLDMQGEAECHRQQMEAMRHAMDRLTAIQRRRYIQHHAHGLSTWQIAEIEGTNQKSVYESLTAAQKKIKKFLAKT